MRPPLHAALQDKHEELDWWSPLFFSSDIRTDPDLHHPNLEVRIYRWANKQKQQHGLVGPSLTKQHHSELQLDSLNKWCVSHPPPFWILCCFRCLRSTATLSQCPFYCIFPPFVELIITIRVLYVKFHKPHGTNNNSTYFNGSPELGWVVHWCLLYLLFYAAYTSDALYSQGIQSSSRSLTLGAPVTSCYRCIKPST